MKALLSIKPEFVEKILSGEKLVEYRKAVFKRPEVKSVVIYSTMPDGLIVGEFEIGQILAKLRKSFGSRLKMSQVSTNSFSMNILQIVMSLMLSRSKS